MPFNATADNLIRPARRVYTRPLEAGEDLMVIDIGEEVKVNRPGAR